ncbi:serine hydrolase domain-containing protein [Arthrobacter castelli]|uniref:serine hydrolase domain-containing protein n=1 Tax=Arthrobacter castelli TaxID=271431 RepID=UPI000428F0E9|nr:serine hydrolase domain-containing protein [Arthrobacter castelli]
MNLRGNLLQLGAELTAEEEAHSFSGVVSIWQTGQSLFERSYGTASRRWNVPVTVDTRFDLASVTKLFTSVAVLQLVDAGSLGLDQELSTVLDLDGTTISGSITIRQLLTHTSGIADDADEEAGESYEALWEDKPNYSVMHTADFLPQFAHKPPNFEPGAGCRYCNCGYVLAGLALEKVTGAGYREHVQSRLFEPAGMTSSGFFHMRDAVPDVAEGWDPVHDDDGAITGWRQNIYSYPPIGSPDGGAHCTAADLIRFLDELRAGELLSPALTQAFFTPQVTHHHQDDGGSIHYGFGLEFELDDGGRVRSFYKDGVNAGASALLRHYPATGITTAILSNSEDGAWAPARLVDEALQDAA